MTIDWDNLIESKVKSFSFDSANDIHAITSKFTNISLSSVLVDDLKAASSGEGAYNEQSIILVLENIEDLFVTAMALGLWSYGNSKNKLSDDAFLSCQRLFSLFTAWMAVVCNEVVRDTKGEYNPVNHKAILVALSFDDWVDAITRIEERSKIYREHI